ncbi:alpha/beta hydrolase [Sphingomonas sp.]|uniref:alpha/beta hydrolase n=1 Tax=Sphingomonas sp. TaxID=28214 RepID=UPI0025DCB6A7|nr:alpha/beta hydrolase [Sphingomonas sp.]
MNVFRDIADRATLEREYSPSSCIDNLPEILADYSRMSQGVRHNTPAYRTLYYGPDQDECLDIFPCASALEGEPRPVMIFIHGGYWQELNKDYHAFPAPDFLRQNVSYIAINYGLAPTASMECMVARCCAAVQWIHANAEQLGIDPDKIHLSGCSAGAHLAAMAALLQPADALMRLASLTLLSGIFDLRPIMLTYVNDPIGLSLQDALTNSPQFRGDISNANLPPVNILFGNNETGEFKRQSREFAETLDRRGVSVVLAEVQGRNHFDLVYDLADPGTTLGTLVVKNLLGQEAAQGMIHPC